MSAEAEQRAVCARFKARFSPPKAGATLGIALPLAKGGTVHGLRHPPEAGTCGWYFWTGENTLADNLFSTLCVEHLADEDERLVRYLALPPGWRILIAPDHEDIWFDPSLFEISDNDI